jgi:hypothetical protein
MIKNNVTASLCQNSACPSEFEDHKYKDSIPTDANYIVEADQQSDWTFDNNT